MNHRNSQKHKMLAARVAAPRGDGETDSMADSTFTLGDTLENASTTSSTATLNGDGNAAAPEADDDQSDPIDNVVKNMQATSLGSSAKPNAEEEMEEDEEYEHKADLKQCLFCNYISPTMDLNVNHMSRQHSFFIPEKDFLVDLAGLINHLSETITVLHQCLYCHKQIHSTPGTQTHMRDRGHCMIAYDTEDDQMEIGEFYDFRSTYSDEETEGEEETAGGVSLGAKRAAKTTVENEEGEDVDMEDDEDGWESDSTLSSVPTDEIGAVPIEHQDHKYEKLGLHRHHSHKDPRPHKNSDGFHSHAHHGTNAVYHDDYELHLPSGRTAGHRSLNKYYRQNLRNYPTPEERAQQRMIEDERHDSDADDEDTEEADTTQQNGGTRGRQLVSRANGGLGMLGVSESKKREIRAVEKRDLKRQQRAQNRYQWGNERRANFQKHFRDPLLQ